MPEYISPFSDLCCSCCPFNGNCKPEWLKGYGEMELRVISLFIKLDFQPVVTDADFIKPDRLELFSVN